MKGWGERGCLKYFELYNNKMTIGVVIITIGTILTK